MFRLRTLGAVIAAAALSSVMLAPGLASADHPGVTLFLGKEYTPPLTSGQSVRVDFGGTLVSGSSVDLLGVGLQGNVVADAQTIPTSQEISQGGIDMIVPTATGTVDYWIALDPSVNASDKNDTMGLTIAPSGKVAPGTTLTATVTNVPKLPSGVTVYLLGIYSANPDQPGAAIADFVPQSACTPDPTTTGTLVCTFPAPAGYNTMTVSFEAQTTNDCYESLPVNNLPEVPLVTALPLALLPAVYLLRRRRRLALR